MSWFPGTAEKLDSLTLMGIAKALFSLRLGWFLHWKTGSLRLLMDVHMLMGIDLELKGFVLRFPSEYTRGSGEEACVCDVWMIHDDPIKSVIAFILLFWSSWIKPLKRQYAIFFRFLLVTWFLPPASVFLVLPGSLQACAWCGSFIGFARCSATADMWQRRTSVSELFRGKCSANRFTSGLGLAPLRRCQCHVSGRNMPEPGRGTLFVTELISKVRPCSQTFFSVSSSKQITGLLCYSKAARTRWSGYKLLVTNA